MDTAVGPSGQPRAGDSAHRDAGHATEFDVFLCYNSQDFEAVEVIEKELTGLGLHVWFDEKQMGGGSVVAQLEHGIEHSRAAVVIVGKDGIGPWQKAEYQAILSQRIDKTGNFTVVPLLLPGATTELIPAFLSAYKHVHFVSTLNDVRILKKLYKCVTGSNLPAGAFEIHIEVEDAAFTCFTIVANESGDSDTCRATQSALSVVNDHLQTQLKYRQGAEDPVKLYAEIRKAELVVIDCTPDAKSGQRDPMVLYQLGLAQAIGKPLIIVTAPDDGLIELFPTPHVIECDRSKENHLEELEQELIREMKVLAFYAILGLVANDSRDVTAAYTDLSHARPMLFEKLQFVFGSGLTLHRYFREIGKHVHRITEDIEDLRIDLLTANAAHAPEEAIVKTGKQFKRYLCRSVERFKSVFSDNDNDFSYEVLKDYATPEATETWAAFEYLMQKTARHAKSCIERSAREFRTTGKRVAHYCGVYESFEATYETVATRFENKYDPEPQIENLADRIQNLERAAREVDRSTTDMMTSMLEVIGGKDGGHSIASVCTSGES